MYGGIHNNHDHIDEGERVKGDRGWEKEEGGGMERLEKNEGGEKAKRNQRLSRACIVHLVIKLEAQPTEPVSLT